MCMMFSFQQMDYQSAHVQFSMWALSARLVHVVRMDNVVLEWMERLKKHSASKFVLIFKIFT